MDDVKRARIEAEQLDIKHVGEPGQRMPVVLMVRGEGPTQAFCRQACLSRRVGSYVSRVVIIDESGIPDLGKSEQSRNAQEQGDKAGSVWLGIHAKGPICL